MPDPIIAAMLVISVHLTMYRQLFMEMNKPSQTVILLVIKWIMLLFVLLDFMIFCITKTEAVRFKEETT